MQFEDLNSTASESIDFGFFKRAHFTQSCQELISLALSIPGINVLAVGPESCIRILYFNALRDNVLDRFTMLTTSRIDSIMGIQTKLVESSLEQIIAEEKDSLKAIIVYVSCIDLLMVSDFNSVFRQLEIKYNIPIKLLKRGPLSKRRLLPKERLSTIFSEILDFYSKQYPRKLNSQSNSVNVIGEVLLSSDSGLKKTLIKEGIHIFNDFMGCATYNQFSNLINADFSIVTHKFGVNIAKYLEKTYNIPYCFVPSRYSLEDIVSNYKKLSDTLHINIDCHEDKNVFLNQLKDIPQIQFEKKIAVGIGDSSLDLTKALLEWGFKVKIVLLDTIEKQDLEKIKEIEKLSEKTHIVPITSITFENEQNMFNNIAISIGELAANYCRNAKKIHVEEKYDFGFHNACRVLSELHE